MQVSVINSSTIPNNKQKFTGNMSRPLAGALANFIEENSNLEFGVKTFGDLVSLDTNPTLNVSLRELDKPKENILNNMKIFYDDAKTGMIGSIEFFLDKTKSNSEVYLSMEKALRKVVPDSFIR